MYVVQALPRWAYPHVLTYVSFSSTIYFKFFNQLTNSHYFFNYKKLKSFYFLFTTYWHLLFFIYIQQTYIFIYIQQTYIFLFTANLYRFIFHVHKTNLLHLIIQYADNSLSLKHENNHLHILFYISIIAFSSKIHLCFRSQSDYILAPVSYMKTCICTTPIYVFLSLNT
jgi:hypothetical protein